MKPFRIDPKNASSCALCKEGLVTDDSFLFDPAFLAAQQRLMSRARGLVEIHAHRYAQAEGLLFSVLVYHIGSNGLQVKLVTDQTGIRALEKTLEQTRFPLATELAVFDI